MESSNPGHIPTTERSELGSISKRSKLRKVTHVASHFVPRNTVEVVTFTMENLKQTMYQAFAL
jgi:hypothetical protein